MINLTAPSMLTIDHEKKLRTVQRNNKRSE
jgi:hypothetical protein